MLVFWGDDSHDGCVDVWPSAAPSHGSVKARESTVVPGRRNMDDDIEAVWTPPEVYEHRPVTN